jgi:hypothetical protein
MQEARKESTPFLLSSFTKPKGQGGRVLTNAATGSKGCYSGALE